MKLIYLFFLIFSLFLHVQTKSSNSQPTRNRSVIIVHADKNLLSPKSTLDLELLEGGMAGDVNRIAPLLLDIMMKHQVSGTVLIAAAKKAIILSQDNPPSTLTKAATNSPLAPLIPIDLNPPGAGKLADNKYKPINDYLP